MIVSTSKPAISTDSNSVNIKYHLYQYNTNGSISAGSLVLSTDRLCQPFGACPNQNLFQQFLDLNSIMMATLMFLPSWLMSSLAALIWWSKFNIAYHMRNTSMDLMHQCHQKLWHGSLNKFTPILCTCVTQTARCFCLISLRRRLRQFRHYLIVQFAMAFHCGCDGSWHTKMMWSYVLFGSLCLTCWWLTTKLWQRSTSIIVDYCVNPLFLWRMTCLSWRNQ